MASVLRDQGHVAGPSMPNARPSPAAGLQRGLCQSRSDADGDDHGDEKRFACSRGHQDQSEAYLDADPDRTDAAAQDEYEQWPSRRRGWPFKTNPTSADGHAVLAQILHETDRLHAAIDEFEKRCG